jgi:phosphatidylinositol 3,5-bisphosphate 5-phosphatase
VNTMETYRKINQWTSHSRDMVESFKRYYNNSFLDGQRQEAYNLFLGNYIFTQGQPMLWDLATDYYLHHADPRGWSDKHRRSYTNWFTPEFLKPREMPSALAPPGQLSKLSCSFFDDYWLEYYRPLSLSSFLKIFSFKLNSALRYIPLKLTQEGKYDLSPFRVRTGNDQEPLEKRKSKKGVTIVDPQDEVSDDASSQVSQATATAKRTSIQRWLQPQTNEKLPVHPSIMKDPQSQGVEAAQLTQRVAADKSLSTQWTLDQFVENSLNPSVTRNEAEEYERYISHPLNLPLVVSTETPPNPSLEFLEYVNSTSPEAVASLHCSEEDLMNFEAFLKVSDNPLTISESDAPKKRYNAYQKWLRGKSIFKQQRVDP